MKTTLQTQLNIADPDGFYEKLLDAHRGLTDEQCAELDARLILLLALLGMWICGGGVYLALGHTTATNGALIYTTSPVIIIVLEAIFFRRRIRDFLDEPAPPNQKGFIAQMVDHGYIFDGPNWEFADSPLQGMYFRPLVYQEVRSMEDFEPWLSRARHCPEEVFDRILRTTPRPWIDGEEERWEQVLEKMLRRRRRIEDLLLHTVRARPQLFPSWRD